MDRASASLRRARPLLGTFVEISVAYASVPDADAAVEQAMKGTLALGSEAVLAGKMFFGAEVVVSDGIKHQRFMVAIGATPLI